MFEFSGLIKIVDTSRKLFIFKGKKNHMDFALFLIFTRTYQNLMHLGGYKVCHDLKVGHFHILWLVPVHIFRSQNMSGFHLVLC